MKKGYVMTLPAKSLTAQTSEQPTPSKEIQKSHDVRSYLVMMVLAVFLMPTGIARAYRGEQQGWTRLWFYVGATVISIIPLIGQLLGGLTLLVLLILGLIDVFTLRHVTTDALGKPLHITPTDKKWAHGFFMYVVVILILGATLLLLAVAFGATLYDQLNSMPVMDEPYMREPQFEPSSF